MKGVRKWSLCAQQGLFVKVVFMRSNASQKDKNALPTNFGKFREISRNSAHFDSTPLFFFGRRQRCDLLEKEKGRKEKKDVFGKGVVFDVGEPGLYDFF